MQLRRVEQAASDEDRAFVRVTSVLLLESTHPVTCTSNLVVGDDKRPTQASKFVWKDDSTWMYGMT